MHTRKTMVGKNKKTIGQFFKTGQFIKWTISIFVKCIKKRPEAKQSQVLINRICSPSHFINCFQSNVDQDSCLILLLYPLVDNVHSGFIHIIFGGVRCEKTILDTVHHNFRQQRQLFSNEEAESCLIRMLS